MPRNAQRVDFGDVTLVYDERGPSDGPLALCLHGFPDTPHTFRHLAPFLVERGYRVVTPAARGYAPSSLASSGDYRLETLASDANRLHEHLGGDESAVIVGHDWGAATTYVATSTEAPRWHRAIAISVPPPAIVAHAFRNFAQLHASWYIFFFQSPLAESLVAHDELAFFEELWRAWSPGYDPTNDLGPVRMALAKPENLSAALAYYRAQFAPRQAAERFAGTSSVPTLYVHGADDGCFLSTGLVDVLASLAPDSRFELIANAGHFVHLEQPDVVHHAIASYLEN
jgi:pimeloyl-ACP methyl ester carboxylesterase